MVLLGTFIRRRVRFFERFCIPAPVIGGLLFAILTCALHTTGAVEITFDSTMRDVCMVFFFTSVGFQMDLKTIKAGGKGLLLLFLSAAILIAFQTVISIALSSLLNVSPLLGLCAGSISMVGGHGTSSAFGPMLENLGLEGATTFCTAAATYGLVVGGLVGGPIGDYLITKKHLMDAPPSESDRASIEEKKEKGVSAPAYASAAFHLVIAVGVGTAVSTALSNLGFTFPLYIGGMIVAAMIRNVSEFSGAFETHIPENDSMGEIFLNLFLGMAMITLELWQLAELALPLLILLSAQTVFLIVYVRFVTFPMMGKDYDAAVIAAGTSGFGLGATPNAMANMQAVCEKYRPSVKAFMLVPIVGGFLNDFTNSVMITFFINLV
jgi:ESS family glutamate:Na+ symporter